MTAGAGDPRSAGAGDPRSALDNPDTIGHELAEYVSDALCSAVAKGSLTLEDLEAAKDAMRSGAVSVQRDEGGTFTVTVGAVAAVQGHIFDLPSVAAEWEAFWQSH